MASTIPLLTDPPQIVPPLDLREKGRRREWCPRSFTRPRVGRSGQIMVAMLRIATMVSLALYFRSKRSSGENASSPRFCAESPSIIATAPCEMIRPSVVRQAILMLVDALPLTTLRQGKFDFSKAIRAQPERAQAKFNKPATHLRSKPRDNLLSVARFGEGEV